MTVVAGVEIPTPTGMTLNNYRAAQSNCCMMGIYYSVWNSAFSPRAHERAITCLAALRRTT